MGGLIDRITYRVTTLTPVHIGSGQELSRHDVGVIGGRLWRFDAERLAELLAGNPRLLDRYVHEGAAALATLSDRAREQCARYVLPWRGEPPAAVREHIADPLGRPYIPGTTIKGAIRTAILWAYNYGIPDEAKQRQANAIGREAKREQAGRPWQEVVFGPNPNRDILRAFRVSDSTPVPVDRILVAGVRIAVQEPDGRLTWFVRAGQHVSAAEEATVLWAEVIPPGVTLTVTVEVDRFLTENRTLSADPAPYTPAERLQFDRKRRFLANWERRCNLMAYHLAREEGAWAKRMRLTALAKFYQGILPHLEQLARSDARPQPVYLQIGWGVGWRGKTALEPLGEAAVQRAREAYGLGRSGHPFPKTRRVVFRDGRAWAPLGWIRLDPLTE